jgi:hypothetical protein
MQEIQRMTARQRHTQQKGKYRHLIGITQQVVHNACVFRTKAATESGAKKPPNPAQSGQRSGAKQPPSFCGVRLS